MRVMETDRGRMGLLGRRTLGPTGIWAQVEEGKGGKPDGGRQAQILQGTPWAAHSSMVGKRRQAAMDGGRGRRPDGRLLRNRARGGEEEGTKRDRSGVDG